MIYIYKGKEVNVWNHCTDSFYMFFVIPSEDSVAKIKSLEKIKKTKHNLSPTCPGHKMTGQM